MSQKLIAKFVAREDEGATAVEYGLMVSLIAVVIIGAVTLIGTNLDTMFRGVAGALASSRTRRRGPDMRAPRQRVDQGATATEYAFVAGLIAVIVIASVASFGVGVRGLFDVLLVSWP